ncbi:hypothetical protein SMICM17S_11124 [Streptomyces microflavus]
MRRFTPDEVVLVSPRHLAGAGVDKIRDALGLLINMFGWTPEKLPPAGHVLLNSPGGEMVLDFTPDRQDSGWWTIAHHEPLWRAEFTRQVPVEAIAAVTQTLPQVLGDDRYADRIPFANEYPASIAKNHGWAIRGTAHGTTWTSPERTLQGRTHRGYRAHLAIHALGPRRFRHGLVSRLHRGHPDPGRRTVRDPPVR